MAGSQPRLDNLNSQNRELAQSSSQPSFRNNKAKIVGKTYSITNFPTSTKHIRKIGGKLVAMFSQIF